MVKGIFLRNHYQADKYTFSNQQIVRYNAVLSGFVASKKHDVGKHLPCGQLFYADMASLMRHNGTKKSGWTDGLHPAAWGGAGSWSGAADSRFWTASLSTNHLGTCTRS